MINTSPQQSLSRRAVLLLSLKYAGSIILFAPVAFLVCAPLILFTGGKSFRSGMRRAYVISGASVAILGILVFLRRKEETRFRFGYVFCAAMTLAPLYVIGFWMAFAAMK